MRFSSSMVVAAMATMLAGCGDEPSVSADAGDGIADAHTADARVPELSFAPCPVITGGDGDEAACGLAQVPADWDDPHGAWIDLFVKRIGPADAAIQLWKLNGGPGASGADFEPLAEYLVSLDDDLAIYLPDHRGTGRSSRLGCPEQEADESPDGIAITEEEWPGCQEAVVETWGDTLEQFTVTAAARDLAWLIDQTRTDDQHVHVWGGSYGTTLAQRYLQLYPDHPDAVSLLGITNPTTTFATYDIRYDEVGKEFLDRCGADEFCASKLGADPAARAQAIWDDLDEGHCAEAGLDKAQLRRFFATLLLWYWHERALIPATLYRLERCEAGDVDALQYLAAVLDQPWTPGEPDRLYSMVLGFHIGVSEIMPADPPPLEEMTATVDEAIFANEAGLRMRRRHDDWPRYTPDELAGSFASTDRPVLMLEGEFDPATPALEAREVADRLDGPGQYYVELEDATHSWTSPTTGDTQCFLAMFFSFVQDPEAPLYDCAGDLLPMDFEGDAGIAAWFGTTDLYDNTAGAAPVSPPEQARELRRRLHRLP